MPAPSGHLRVLLFFLGSIAVCRLVGEERIIVEARLNDQPIKLAFDSGADNLVIFRSVAERLHLKIVSAPADTTLAPGQILLSRTEPAKIEFLGKSTMDARLAVIDLPNGPPIDVDGLLGWTIIRDNIWLLSGSELTFKLLPAVPPETAGWIKLRELRDRKLLGLELPREKNDPPAYLGIDTGAASGVRLSAEIWAKWRAAHPRQPVTLQAYAMPGVPLVVAEEGWADEIDLGGLTLREVPVICMNPVETIRQPPGTVAVLGLTAMQRMDTILDGRHGLAYCHPLNTPAAPYEHNRLGAVFVPEDPRSDNDLVAHVAADSPAAVAGVRTGDVLVKIDQLDVTPWRTQPGILPLGRFWEQAPGTKLHLTLRRDSKIVSADVMLRDILGPTKASEKSP